MINAILHRVSKRIVSLALVSNSYIALGDLTGIRRRVNGRGKRLNRIVNNMPYYRLTKMIEYKAMLVGIPVITTSEAYTSQTCHICGCEGKKEDSRLVHLPPLWRIQRRFKWSHKHSQKSREGFRLYAFSRGYM
ncbi:IS200/IS605 family accessory protein TnpB-related protein [Candidatus Bathyarchaeota archaeon]|nr:IS200/IS605 family accessory protein TnpB-related protein [Candidatus Bathyarchaeota archaeon]